MLFKIPTSNVTYSAHDKHFELNCIKYLRSIFINQQNCWLGGLMLSQVVGFVEGEGVFCCCLSWSVWLAVCLNWSNSVVLTVKLSDIKCTGPDGLRHGYHGDAKGFCPQCGMTNV